MPLPPMQFVDLYTDAAVASGAAPPPPPPILAEPYSMFGAPFSADDAIIQSLEAQGIKRLYSSKDVDRKKELHKLNQSILTSFLDLLDILIRAPDSAKREEKLEDLNLLFIHAHHLINEFRPHQARETLRMMLHVQKRKRIQVAERFQTNLDSVQEIIEEALRALPEGEEESREAVVMGQLAREVSRTSVTVDDEANAVSADVVETECVSDDRALCGLAAELLEEEVSADQGDEAMDESEAT